MMTMANGSTMTISRSKAFVNPVGFSNGWAPPVPS